MQELLCDIKKHLLKTLKPITDMKSGFGTQE